MQSIYTLDVIGGGSQSDIPRRDKDDDDLKWARKCALTVSRSLGKKP